MQYKINQTKDEDNPDIPFLQEDKHISFVLKEQTYTQRIISFVLDQEIKDPSYYRPLLENIYQANEGDSVIMRIDSYGGSVDGALAIIDAIENTDANVHCYVSGMAASAATIIALSCPNVSVSKRARFMIHNASFGSLGKVGDVINHTQFVDQQIKSLMTECYSGFLSAQELAEVFLGRDIYMSAPEIEQRLEKRFKYLEKLGKQSKRKAQPKDTKPKQNILEQSELLP